jgi:hypothetical protein
LLFLIFALFGLKHGATKQTVATTSRANSPRFPSGDTHPADANNTFAKKMANEIAANIKNIETSLRRPPTPMTYL